MEEFNKVACSIVDMMESLASVIVDDERVREYFIEHYRYEEIDDSGDVLKFFKRCIKGVRFLFESYSFFVIFLYYTFTLLELS